MNSVQKNVRYKKIAQSPNEEHYLQLHRPHEFTTNKFGKFKQDYRQCRSIHHVCKFNEWYHTPPHPTQTWKNARNITAKYQCASKNNSA